MIFRANVTDTLGHGRQQRADDGELSADYALYLLKLTSRLGVQEKAVLQGTCLSRQGLTAPDARIPGAAFLKLVERALLLTQEPALGIHFGLSEKLASHGALGLLAMTSPTVGAALASAQRFLSLRAANVAWLAKQEDNVCQVELLCDVAPGPVQRFLIECSFVSILNMGRALVGHTIPAATVCCAFAEPPYFKRLAHVVPAKVTFLAERNLVCFPASVLSEAVVTADSIVAKRVAQTCEAELTQLNAQARTISKIRRTLRAAGKDLPSLNEMALTQHMSERTLKRRIAEHGTTYRALVDEVRRERATTLLAQPKLTVEQVATRLGYTDPAAFHRAFQRWYGTTPGLYRDA